jgi:hypothetical protein
MKLSAAGLPAIAAVVLACTLPSQVNLIVNGDFETKTIAPWVESGWASSSKVSMHDCAGAGLSYTFNCLHGGKSGQTRRPNGYWPGNAIEQTVLMVQTAEYLFTADVQIQNVQSPSTGNADAGLIELFIGGVSVGKHNFGSYAGNSKPRARMCFRFKGPSTGLKAFKLDFSRRYYSSGRTPTAFIDNILLTLAPSEPIICPLLERKINATATIDIAGTASSRFALFYGTGKFASGVRVPGFSGAWWLSGVSGQMFVNTFSGTGNFIWKPMIPNDPGLVGFLIHWQAVEANTRVSIGEVTSFAFYR